MGRICTPSAGRFTCPSIPPLASSRAALRQRSPHRSGADSGRRAGPGRRLPRRPARLAADGAHRRQPAPATLTSCVPGHADASNCRRAIVAHGDAQRRRDRSPQVRRDRPAAPPDSQPSALQPQKNLAAMRIERRRRHSGLARQHFQPRNRDHRNPLALGQALHRAQPHAHAGKAARPVDGDDAAEPTQSVPADRSNSPTAATSVAE